MICFFIRIKFWYPSDQENRKGKKGKVAHTCAHLACAMLHTKQNINKNGKVAQSAFIQTKQNTDKTDYGTIKDWQGVIV